MHQGIAFSISGLSVAIFCWIFLIENRNQDLGEPCCPPGSGTGYLRDTDTIDDEKPWNHPDCPEDFPVGDSLFSDSISKPQSVGVTEFQAYEEVSGLTCYLTISELKNVASSKSTSVPLRTFPISQYQLVIFSNGENKLTKIGNPIHLHPNGSRQFKYDGSYYSYVTPSFNNPHRIFKLELDEWQELSKLDWPKHWLDFSNADIQRIFFERPHPGVAEDRFCRIAHSEPFGFFVVGQICSETHKVVIKIDTDNITTRSLKTSNDRTILKFPMPSPRGR